jgi:hypothetical protein
VKRASLTDTVAVLGFVVPFCPNETVTVASPVPVPGLSCTQFALLPALHAQSRVVSMETVRALPDAGTLEGSPETRASHRDAPGPVSCDTDVSPHAESRRPSDTSRPRV